MEHTPETSQLYTDLGITSHNSAGQSQQNAVDSSSEQNVQLIQPAPKPIIATPSGSTFQLTEGMKKVLPFVAIFIIGFVAYLVLFTNVSFKSFFHINSQPKNVAASQIIVPAEQTAAYNAWISSYFYDVSDKTIVDPNTDISGNGLTNYQKFLLGLNPKVKSTAGLSMTDAEALIAGIDPLTGGPLTDQEKSVISANIDLEALANKISLNAATQSVKLASAHSSGADRSTGFSSITIDTSKQAEINIPSLNITVPVIWSNDTNALLTDLEKGLVHYPGTALPGQQGTSYISGHSSNYVWAKGKYNNIFAHLDKLKKYDSFTLTATNSAGKKVVFHYVVNASGVFQADDQAQFADIGRSSMALSTCWPVGTSNKRLVVFAGLTQVDQ